MTCRDLDPDIVDLARNALSGPAAWRVREHVETCASCAARLERERLLTEALRDVDDAVPATRFDRMEDDLLAAFAAQHPGPDRHRAAFASWRAAHWLAAAAALVLAAAGWAGWAWRDASKVTPEAVAAAPQGTALSQPVPTPVAGVSAAVVPTADAPAAARASRVAPPVPVVAALRFVPLPSAAGLPNLESGRVVRVEVPMGALPAYGIDVGPDDAARVVEADVLVGQDGQPRAIRFVNTDTDSRRRQ